ncbi:hypothetical protein OC861_002040 [Tilletia horrida]|nr:hypothetical protein OC861_002040 [Tilletia horrida]
MRNGIAVRAGPPDVMDIFKQLHIFDSRVAETFTSRYANWKSLSSRLDRALASGTEHMNDEEFAEVRQLILDTDQAKMSLQAIIDHMYGFLPNYLRPKLPGL